MKLFLLEYTDSRSNFPIKCWKGSKGEAETVVKEGLKHGTMYNDPEPKITSVEVPTKKADLIEWLNENCA